MAIDNQETFVHKIQPKNQVNHGFTQIPTRVKAICIAWNSAAMVLSFLTTARTTAPLARASGSKLDASSIEDNGIIAIHLNQIKRWSFAFLILIFEDLRNFVLASVPKSSISPCWLHVQPIWGFSLNTFASNIDPEGNH